MTDPEIRKGTPPPHLPRKVATKVQAKRDVLARMSPGDWISLPRNEHFFSQWDYAANDLGLQLYHHYHDDQLIIVLRGPRQ